MLAAFERWGLEKSLQRFVGMFAFALWDRETRALHLVRDRLGIKPLYYGWAGGTFIFGSEMKIFEQIPTFERSIHRDSLAAFMRGKSPGPVKTFTIGVYDEDHNEAVQAVAVAKHLGTEQTELYVTPTEAMAVIPRLPDMYDEPFADSSQIPTYLVSHLARKHV